MKEHVNKQVDSWIHEKKIPPPANRKPVLLLDGLYPEDQEEQEAYWDFIHWAMAQEHAVLLSVPKHENDYDFWQVEVDELGNNVSAFNTMDFERMYPQGFNRYAYRLKKVYEKVYDLALLHSCISHDEGKKNTHKRFKHLVEREFRDRAEILVETLKRYGVWVNRVRILKEITGLNKRIRKCNEIWQRHAYQN